MTIKCDLGCEDLDDPIIEMIGDIFYSTVDRVFKNKDCYLLDENFNERHVTPWVTESSDELEYQIYDWKKAQGKWAENYTKTIWICSYPAFLIAANQLGNNLDFYYLTSPQVKNRAYKTLIQSLLLKLII